MSGPTVSSVLDLIGNTPLIKVTRLTAGLAEHVDVYVKAEWFNPGGSVKDRAARGIVLKALRSKRLRVGGRLLDSSSGNTGIGYAMLGAALGFDVTLCVPANINPERRRTLLAYGAHLILTDPAEGSDGALLAARELHAKDPERYFYADQYGNDGNWLAHFETTGPELVAQTKGRLSHFVAGLGTSGTCMGVGRFLRTAHPSAKVIAFEPDSPFHGLEGMKHMSSALVPNIYDPAVPHEHRTISTERAYETCQRAAKEEGLFIGISAAASLSIALDLAREESAARRAAVIVSLGCDGGARYLSERLWAEPDVSRPAP